MEYWIDIEGYKGFYQVSNYGRVKGLKRSYYTEPKNGKRRLVTVKGKILKPHYVPVTKKYGMYQVTLNKNGNQKRFYIHRLVANAFLIKPNGRYEINHKDSNPLNNYVNNLEWVTHKENMNHCFAKGRGNNKIVNQFNLNGRFIKSWNSTMQVQRELGFSNGNISNACLGRVKSAYGYVWKYEQNL